MDEPRPEDWQRPLTRWGHTWRVLGCLALSALVWGQYADAQASDMPGLFWLDLGLGVASYVLMLYRRRWPLAVALVLNAATLLSGVAAGPATLAAVSLATRRRLPPIVLVALVAVLAGTGYVEIQPDSSRDPLWLSLGVGVVAIAGIMGWGMYIGSRRELLWTLQSRAERAEAEQELRVAQSRGTERARIAREMHDVLAHRISQISLHAGALSFREDLSADEVRASAAVIQDKAHEALTDLRGVLGVLRDQSGEPMHAPQPTYADVPALVEEARLGGLHVELVDRLGADGQPVPDAVGRTLYRIIQEGLTNARKHAPGATLTIELSGSPEDGIDLVVRNPLGFGRTSTPGAGLGLVGLTERAALRGGTLEHRREGGSFVLRGWIPWAA